MTTIHAREMKLRDVVQGREPAPFSTGVVIQITEDGVHIFRPYAITSDLSYTAGVIPYIGSERYIVPLDSSAKFLLLDRPPVPR